MQRRTFIQSLTSAISVSSLGFTAGLQAAPSDFANQKKWIFVHASGGWDPTSFCDPKGQIEAVAGKGMINTYSNSFIKKVGNINYVSALNETQEPNFNLFFEKYYRELRIINGINMNTNSHSVGVQLASSGDMRTNQITFPALYALTLPSGSRPPLAFVEDGGYTNTGGLIAKTRLSALPSVSQLNDSYKMGTVDVLPKALFDKVILARDARLNRLQATSALPMEKKRLTDFEAQRISANDLKALTPNIPATLNANSKFKNIQYLLAAMKTGLTIGGQVSVGGFDTHSNHDDGQYKSLKTLFETVDFIVSEAERQGIRNLVNIAIFSDFSRTPYFNTDKGKDHWSNGSMMLMGPDIVGNRVIGATNDQFKGRKLNRTTLAVDDVNGAPLNIADVHASLRKLIGINGLEIDSTFSVAGTAINNLFTG